MPNLTYSVWKSAEDFVSGLHAIIDADDDDARIDAYEEFILHPEVARLFKVASKSPTTGKCEKVICPRCDCPCVKLREHQKTLKCLEAYSTKKIVSEQNTTNISEITKKRVSQSREDRVATADLYLVGDEQHESEEEEEVIPKAKKSAGKGKTGVLKVPVAKKSKKPEEVIPDVPKVPAKKSKSKKSGEVKIVECREVPAEGTKSVAESEVPAKEEIITEASVQENPEGEVPAVILTEAEEKCVAESEVPAVAKKAKPKKIKKLYLAEDAVSAV